MEAQSFWMNVLGSAVSGLVSGVIVAVFVLIAEYIIRRKEKSDDKSIALQIRFPHSERMLDESIFTHLPPGGSVELMRSVLGPPDRTFQDEAPVFETYREEEEGLIAYEFDSDDEKERFERERLLAISYIYDFKNATVKVTSKNKEVIASLAVEVKQNYTLDASGLPHGFVADSGEDETTFILVNHGSTGIWLKVPDGSTFFRATTMFLFALCIPLDRYIPTIRILVFPMGNRNRIKIYLRHSSDIR